MSKRLLGVLVSVCLLGGDAGAQSLGDVAKRERERREKNKSEGVAAKEFTEEEIFGPAEEAPDVGDAEADAEAPEGLTLEEDAPIEIGSAVPSDVSPDALDRERADRQKSEAEWRARLQQARARIEQARARKQQLAELHLAEGEYYVDTDGNVIIRSLAHLQELVAEAAQDLQDAEAALASLLEEARRAGVPPGWLR